MGAPRAVLDLGTNSTRFLMINKTPRSLRPEHVLDRDARVTRLGEGVDSRSRLSETAIERVLDCVRDYDRRVRDRDGRWMAAYATSACRRASNREEFFNRVETVVGVRPELISGQREAELTCRGVQWSLPELRSGRVMDIGGGSTEWITFREDRIESVESLPLGVVTLKERCVTEDRWTEIVRRCVEDEIASAFSPRTPGEGELVVVGGTGTTVSAVLHDLEEYVSSLIHGDRITKDRLEGLIERFATMEFDEIADHPMVSPGRQDVILPGMLILLHAIQQMDLDHCIVSDFGILAGSLRDVRTP